MNFLDQDLQKLERDRTDRQTASISDEHKFEWWVVLVLNHKYILCKLLYIVFHVGLCLLPMSVNNEHID